ncbi:hypothetical protein FPK17_12490 [Mycobacterium tuberculosis]|nr:hypothetical protein FPK17_12490 [Mycobacterium tuberculosis]
MTWMSRGAPMWLPYEATPPYERWPARDVVNRPGMSGDSSSWKGWGHVRWFIEEVPAGAA